VIPILAFAGVALRRFFRERGNWFFVLVFPLALVLLIGQQFGDGGGLPEVGVVVGEGGEELRAALADAEGLELVDFDSAAEMEDRLARGRLAAGVLVGDERSDAGLPVVRFVTGSGADAPAAREVVTAALTGRIGGDRDAGIVADVTGAPQEAVDEAFAQVAPFVPGVEVVRETIGQDPFEGAGSPYEVGAAGQLLLFVFITSLTGSAALIQTRQFGVTRRALSAPIGTRTVLAGEALGRLVIALLQAAVIVVGTTLLFGVDWGDPLASGAVIVLFCLVGAGAAMLVGAISDNDQQAAGVGVMAGLGLAALGGSMVPLEIFPDTLRTVAHVTPHAWGNEALAEITRRQGGIGDILPELGALVVFAVVIVSLAAWRLRAAVLATGR
jgi:ABC-2 type transport system permease protein